MSGGCEQGVVCPLLEPDLNVALADAYGGGGVDKVPEEASGFGVFIAIAELPSQEPVEAAAHEDELEITVDLHGDGVHVEEDAVLDEHALGVAGDQLGSAALELVSKEQGRLFVAEIHDGDLADGFHGGQNGNTPLAQARAPLRSIRIAPVVGLLREQLVSIRSGIRSKACRHAAGATWNIP